MLTVIRNDETYSRKVLEGILGRRRLTFNPYTVSDERLMEISRSVGWGNSRDITEIITVRFTRLHPAQSTYYLDFDGIYMTVGMSEEEIFIPLGALTKPIIANDTMQQERCWVGKKRITRPDQVERMVGKTYFVSRVVRGVNQFGNGKCAYRFHRLTGKVDSDANIIREAMCAAKIEMLERVMNNPRSPVHLNCYPGLFDYETPIREAIEVIRRFHEAADDFTPIK